MRKICLSIIWLLVRSCSCEASFAPLDLEAELQQLPRHLAHSQLNSRDQQRRRRPASQHVRRRQDASEEPGPDAQRRPACRLGPKAAQPGGDQQAAVSAGRLEAAGKLRGEAGRFADARGAPVQSHPETVPVWDRVRQDGHLHEVGQARRGESSMPMSAVLESLFPGLFTYLVVSGD